LDLSYDFDVIKGQMKAYLDRLTEKKKKSDTTHLQEEQRAQVYAQMVKKNGKDTADEWLEDYNQKYTRTQDLYAKLTSDWQRATKELQAVQAWVIRHSPTSAGVRKELTRVAAALDPILNAEEATALQKEIETLEKSVAAIDDKIDITREYRLAQFKETPSEATWEQMQRQHSHYLKNNITEEDSSDKGFDEAITEVHHLLKKIEECKVNLEKTINLSEAAEWLHPTLRTIFDSRRKDWRDKITNITVKTLAAWKDFTEEVNFLGVCAYEKKQFTRYNTTGELPFFKTYLGFRIQVPAIFSSDAIESWDSPFKRYPPLHEKFEPFETATRAAKPNALETSS
jgi:predicted  nucleic acid-binding Zn-ribbon protein